MTEVVSFVLRCLGFFAGPVLFLAGWHSVREWPTAGAVLMTAGGAWLWLAYATTGEE